MNLLFDDFAQFMDYHYSNRLREVRKAYGLNQTDLEGKAEISHGIYAKWETAVRQPSLVLFTNLLTSCKLNNYLADIDEQAEDMFSRLAKEMAEKHGITEQLKAAD